MIARLKLYLAAVAVGFAAMWQVVRVIRKSERNDIERERASRRVDAMREAGRIRDDVESDPYIVDRAHEWLRRKDQ
jgi:uncharacterized membrane protein (UPF0182 family)